MLNDSFKLIKGSCPLFISMPHNGIMLPPDITKKMSAAGLDVSDTDWYMDKLYDFALTLGAWILTPTYSRYVIDLNRAPTGENLYPGANSTELCPTTSFDLQPLYQAGCEPDAAEITSRIQNYWQPYHGAISQSLAVIKQQFGIAVLLDAHSIRSEVPRFFEGQLPDFNFGTADGVSCDRGLIEAVSSIDFKPYTTITNGRFKGGFITRNYGKPEQNIHSIQLELSQRTYMNEPSSQLNEQNAAAVKIKLQQFVAALINFANQHGK